MCLKSEVHLFQVAMCSFLQSSFGWAYLLVFLGMLSYPMQSAPVQNLTEHGSHRLRHDRHNRHHRRLTSESQRRHDFRQAVKKEHSPIYLSDYVVLSPTIPEMPPWYIIQSDSHEKLEKSQKYGSKRRTKRTSGMDADSISLPACQGVSGWVQRSEADDMWGNTVRVAQNLDIGGARVNQYFYETFCYQENYSCRGIDTTKYKSACQNKYIWAYAKTIDSAGEEGWNLVKIRGSCNCALFPFLDGSEGFPVL